MLNNLIIGPPLAGGTDFRVGERAGNGDGSDQFDDLLSQTRIESDDKGTINLNKEKVENPERKSLSKEKNAPTVKQSEKVQTKKSKVEIDQKTEPKTEQRVSEESQVDNKEIETASPQQKQTREQVIQKFMDSLESEFGIPSTRLVGAMKDLTPEQLRLPPEQTAEVIISKLNLDEKDQDRAQAMYISMLMNLSKVEAKPTPLMSLNEASAVGTIAATRNNFAKERTQSLNQSIDQLNQQFWSTPKSKEVIQVKDQSLMPHNFENINLNQSNSDLQSEDLSSTGELNQEVISSDENKLSVSQIEPKSSVPAKGQNLNPQGLQNLPPHLQAQLKEVSQGTSLAAMAQKIAQQQLSHLSNEDRQKMSQIDAQQLQDSLANPSNYDSINAGQVGEASQASLSQMSGGLSQNLSEQNQNGNSGEQQQQPEIQVGPQQKLSKQALQRKLVEKGMDSQGTLKKLEALHQQLISGESMNQLPPLKDNLQGIQPMVAAGPIAVSQMDHEKNVQQLLNQAQYLVKKGGGEVKVQMTPEGLGQVQLKVELQDGKVNVHVQAESPEVKKTIESSLAELKTSLAAHKLSMEHIKVDVVNSTSSDVAAQNQNQNQSGNGGQFERDQTRQFWQQFQQNFGNPGARSSMYEIGDTRNYGRKQPDALEPMSANSTTRQKRVIEGRGQGLNVVA